MYLGLPKRPNTVDVLGKRSGNEARELFERFLLENEQSAVCRDVEMCPSGLRCTLGKRVCESTGGSNPLISAKVYIGCKP